MNFLDRYDVVFICYLANYYWKEIENLSLLEAIEEVKNLNKREKIHKYNGCCQYIIQKQN